MTCGQLKWMPKILRALEELGVGEAFGEVDVVPLSTTKPILVSRNKSKREYR